MVIAYELGDVDRNAKNKKVRKVKWVNNRLYKGQKDFLVGRDGKVKSTAYGGLDENKQPRAMSYQEAYDKIAKVIREARHERYVKTLDPEKASKAKTVPRKKQPVEKDLKPAQKKDKNYVPKKTLTDDEKKKRKDARNVNYQKIFGHDRPEPKRMKKKVAPTKVEPAFDDFDDAIPADDFIPDETKEMQKNEIPVIDPYNHDWLGELDNENDMDFDTSSPIIEESPKGSPKETKKESPKETKKEKPKKNSEPKKEEKNDITDYVKANLKDEINECAKSGYIGDTFINHYLQDILKTRKNVGILDAMISQTLKFAETEKEYRNADSADEVYKLKKPMKEYDKVYIPIFYSIGPHWILGVYTPKEKSLEVYDSEDCSLKDYKDELDRMKTFIKVKTGNKVVTTIKKRCPKQNDVSCGCYVIENIERLIGNKPLNYTFNDMHDEIIPNQVKKLCKKFGIDVPDVHINNREEPEKIPPVSGVAFKSLEPKQWVDDEIIDKYLELIKNETNSDIVVKSMHWYETVEKNREVEIPKDEGVLMPIKKGNHWILAFKYGNLIQIFNSFKQEYKDVNANLKKVFGKVDIEYVYPKDPQKNGYDCGIYVCKTAEKILKCEEPPFKFGNLDKAREEIKDKIENEIGHKKRIKQSIKDSDDEVEFIGVKKPSRK